MAQQIAAPALQTSNTEGNSLEMKFGKAVTLKQCHRNVRRGGAQHLPYFVSLSLKRSEIRCSLSP